MANDEIDYNIVFPDAGTSGEHHFIVLQMLERQNLRGKKTKEIALYYTTVKLNEIGRTTISHFINCHKTNKTQKTWENKRLHIKNQRLHRVPVLMSKRIKLHSQMLLRLILRYCHNNKNPAGCYTKKGCFLTPPNPQKGHANKPYKMQTRQKAENIHSHKYWWTESSQNLQQTGLSIG